jgi:hypothetical protein
MAVNQAVSKDRGLVQSGERLARKVASSSFKHVKVLIRRLCYLGNMAVLTTSLMNPLGLSRGALKDRFPMLLPLFRQPTILSSMNGRYPIDATNDH